MQSATTDSADETLDEEGTLTVLIPSYATRTNVGATLDDVLPDSTQVKAIDNDSSKLLFAVDERRDEKISAFSNSSPLLCCFPTVPKPLDFQVVGSDGLCAGSFWPSTSTTSCNLFLSLASWAHNSSEKGVADFSSLGET